MTNLSDAGHGVLDTILEVFGNLHRATQGLPWSRWGSELDIIKVYQTQYEGVRDLRKQQLNISGSRNPMTSYHRSTRASLSTEYAYSYDEVPEVDQETIKEILSRAIKTNGKSLETENPK